MSQRCHPHSVNHARRLGRVIHRNQRVVIAAVPLGKGGGRNVCGERADMPGTDAQGVLHLQRLDEFSAIEVATATVNQAGALPMRAFIVEITAKVIVRSNTDPEELPADIYSHIAEFIRNDDDILDLEVHAVPLPADLSGSAPH